MIQISCWADRSYELDPAHSALVVIDMQRGFLAEEVSENAELRAIMPRLKTVIAAARERGFMIVHTREGYGADRSDVTAAKAEMAYVGRPTPRGEFLIRGTPSHDFMEGFEPRESEAVIDKAAFNAFHESPLGDLLNEGAITHLVLTGVTTQCCVHSTLRDAVDRGFLCLTLEDCCAAYRRQWHDATMDIIQSESNLFGWIASSSSFLAGLTPSRAGA